MSGRSRLVSSVSLFSLGALGGRGEMELGSYPPPKRRSLRNLRNLSSSALASSMPDSLALSTLSMSLWNCSQLASRLQCLSAFRMTSYRFASSSERSASVPAVAARDELMSTFLLSHLPSLTTRGSEFVRGWGGTWSWMRPLLAPVK